MSTDDSKAVREWWRTSIIDMAPGQIRLRGHPIETLIGTASFVDTIWLMTRGQLPEASHRRLLEAALVAAVDHGPQAPSIAAARMAISCGLDINNAMGSAVNMLGDVHGGAGEQAIELYQTVLRHSDFREQPVATVSAVAQEWQRNRSRYLPGFGHRFHDPIDPRAPRLLSLVDQAAAEGAISGDYALIARHIESELAKQKGRAIPMNIDGATAVIYAELGFEPPLARGLFCLSRSVGILAHSWEQMGESARNKGPTPPEFRWQYDGDNPIDTGHSS